jgi:hypothetical protein
MTSYSVADLQALPETDPIAFSDEFGLRPCTVSCKDSCAYTCGSLSCTHTAGLTDEETATTDAVIRAQEEQLKAQKA